MITSDKTSATVSESVNKMLDDMEEQRTRREMRELTTWDFFVHSTSQKPMYVGNPVLEAASAWEFGQQYWTNDEVIADSDENENLYQLRKMMRSGCSR